MSIKTFTPQNLAKLNETLTLTQINELVSDRERLDALKQTQNYEKKNAARIIIELKKARRGVKKK